MRLVQIATAAVDVTEANGTNVLVTVVAQLMSVSLPDLR